MTTVLMYSFKGGAGRTVTTANIGYILASELNKRVCLVDLDVESAGASVLFDIDDAVESSTDAHALQDLLARAASDGILNRELFPDVWSKAARTLRDAEGKILLPNYILLPSRRTLRTPDEAVFGTPAAGRLFESLLQRIDLHWRPDITLMDSASGIQQTAILGLENADVLVIFLRWTKQFLKGTQQFIKDQLLSQPDLWERLRNVYVVPTAVPPLDSPHATHELQQRTSKLHHDIVHLNGEARRLLQKPNDWIRVGPSIPETYALKWEDRIFLREDYESTNLRPVQEAYLALAQLLVNA